ncbi:Asp-domain-containing protein [Suillus lakei]|nr:Asp-domain-containing protein [Suillus lakei]
MRLTAAFTSLLCLFTLGIALPVEPLSETLRVPLERKYVPPHWQSAAHENYWPTHLDPSTSPTRLHLMQVHLLQITNKYMQTLAIFEANTGSPHPLAASLKAVEHSVTESVGTHQPGLLARSLDGGSKKKGSLLLTDDSKMLWQGSIEVGTPKQIFTVDIDTGSSDFLLPSVECDSSCNGHTRYDPSSSSTSLDLNKTFTITYGDGSNVQGGQYKDDVFLGGYKAKNQILGGATSYSSGFNISAYLPDGLLGLAWPSLSVYPAGPVFNTLINQNVIKDKIFGIALSSQPGKSELSIGGTNTAFYKQNTIVWMNIMSHGYWEVSMDSLGRNGKTVVGSAQAIVDSGTSLIIGGMGVVKVFYDGVVGAMSSDGGIWTVPCSTIDSIAPTLTFGSKDFAVSAATFNLGPVSQGSSDCIAGIAGSQGMGDYWIVGDVFMQNVYSIFDMGSGLVGFADLS